MEDPLEASSRSSALVIGLDADDTLWDNESHFAKTEDQFRTLATRWTDPAAAMKRLVEIERTNVALYGYGVKSFVLSMTEAAIELSSGAVTSSEISGILGWGKDLLSVAPELLPGVVETVERLRQRHRVLIITKGDLHHQGLRVDGSGLRSRVDAVEIVAEKDVATYRRILELHNIDAEEFVMVGNSVKSDVLPVRELGGHAVHIPFHLTWALEQVDEGLDVDWFAAESITEVPGIVELIENGT